MKPVPVDKFREQMSSYLEGIEPLVIEREGEILGFYYPKNKTKKPELKQTVDRLETLLKQILAKNGMTEDEFADLFDTSKPFPYDKPSS